MPFKYSASCVQMYCASVTLNNTREKARYTHEYSVCTAPYMHVHIQSIIDRGPQSPYLQHQSILSLVPHRITYVSPLFEPEGLSYFLVKPTSSNCGGRNGVV